ncbi:MAG: hypothetical protein DRQ42_03000 [Gammaproteobacteria bacterium]|nr:MAG: hypothetical protein DRQ42_03000 [Gammaproteobacteria bacterium]
MASGRLGAADLAAVTITDVYTVPLGVLTSMNINVCNRNDSIIRIRLAMSSVSGAQANEEYIEYDTTIEPYGVLERTGIALDSGKFITAYSDTANVSVVITGIEDIA